MAKPKGPPVPAVAEAVADGLAAAISALAAVPPAGARDLPVLLGVNKDGTYSVPFETARHRFEDIAEPSGRVYRFGSDVVFETRAGGGPGLLTIQAGTDLVRGAPTALANLLLCQVPGKGEPVQFTIPPTPLAAFLAADAAASRLPRINLYARRPVFGPDYVLLGPGFHPETGVLVHGPAVEPVLDTPPGPTPLDRLPATKKLLGEFCFAEPADLANTLAALVTGLLSSHYADGSKPVLVVDGNQPGVGKSLLVRLIGVLLDGADPDPIVYTPDQDELAKRVCATLRSNGQSVLPFDNAKSTGGGAVSSSVIEGNSTAPVISLRVLGSSQNYRRPNDVIWAITMNQSRLSPDLVTRSLPVRLAYAGDAGARSFAGPGDPVGFAREHRLDILGELAGLVVRWNQAGRPAGGRTHRFHAWAKTVGGILEYSGFTDFLANAQAAAAAFDADLNELAELFDAVLADAHGPWAEVSSLEYL